MSDILIITLALTAIVSLTAAALRFDFWQKKQFHIALDYLYNGEEYFLPGNPDWIIQITEHGVRTAAVGAGIIWLAILWKVSGAPQPPDTMIGDIATMAAALPIAMLYTQWTMHKTWRTRVIIAARQEARSARKHGQTGWEMP